MKFWLQFEEGSPAAEAALPPLTDEEVRSFESRYNVTLPKRLVTLLKEQNGGSLVHDSFKFHGKDYYLDDFLGLSGARQFGTIKPLSEVFDFRDKGDLEALIKGQIGNPELVFLFGVYGDHCMYALDYNRAYEQGEPKVIYFIPEGDSSGVSSLASNFGDFLKGNYPGEPTPSVNLEDVSKETLLVETRSAGRHVHGGTALEFFSWVCDRKKELIVFSRSTRDGNICLRRSVVPKESLAPDFCEISKVKYVSEPAIYELLLHVDPNRSWVTIDDAKQCETVWKNTAGKVVYDSVYSHDRDQLVQLSKRIFPNYQGTPTSLTNELNGLLKNLGIIND